MWFRFNRLSQPATSHIFWLLWSTALWQQRGDSVSSLPGAVPPSIVPYTPSALRGCSAQRSTTALASARAAASATCRLALVATSRPRVRTPIAEVCPAVAANPSAAFWFVLRERIERWRGAAVNSLSIRYPSPLPMSHHRRAVRILDLEAIRDGPKGRHDLLRSLRH
jgi:hypothetical protein